MRYHLRAEDALLIGACTIWGTNFVVIKAALREFSPLAFNGLRFPVAAGLLLFLQWHREGLTALRPHLGRLIWLGLIGDLGYQLFFIYGLNNTGAGEASLFSSTTPLFTFLIARASGHDRGSRRVGVGLAIAATGLVLLLRESFSGTMMGRRYWLGDLLLLGSAACWASYTVYSQPLLTKVRPLALTSVSMAAGGLPLLILGLPEIARMEPTRISLTAWGGLGYATLMALVVGYLAWSQGVSVLGSTRTAIYLNLVPVVAVVVAWWWLGERLGLVQALGATGVVLGIGLSRSGSVQGAAA